MGNPYGVDKAYVISVKALREILKEISTDEGHWWIAEDKSYSIVIGFALGKMVADELNNILFEFPKVASISLFPDGDGEIVCVYPISREAVQRGLYWENNRLLNDEVKDWEAFWPPLKTAIAKRYSEGGSMTTITPPPSRNTV
jgi:hypothetical protein